MSAPAENTRLNTCGCCNTDVTSDSRENAPGLSSILYRAGTYASFFARMKSRIHAWRVAGIEDPPLAALKTSATTDPALALLDAWAVAADVVTFYQERIANEGFLGTATERRSVLWLARAIGYELNPGVAASTYLAFTVDDAEGAPTEAAVSKGTQVMSVPAQKDELPQIFETDADLTAYLAWNAMRPLTLLPNLLSASSYPTVDDLGEITLDGTATGLAKGDLLLLVVQGDPQFKRIGAVEPDTDAATTRIVFLDGSEVATAAAPEAQDTAEFDPDQETLALTKENVNAEVFRKQWAESDLQAFLTLHDWDEDTLLAYVETLREEAFASEDAVFALRDRVSFFGYNAPRWAMLPESTTTTTGSVDADFAALRAVNDKETTTTLHGGYRYDWDADSGRTVWQDSQVGYLIDVCNADVLLERAVAGVIPGGWVVFTSPDSEVDPTIYLVAGAAETSRTDFAISSKVTALLLENPDSSDPDRTLSYYTRTALAHVRSEELLLAPLVDESELAAGTILELWLDSMVLGLTEGQVVVLSGEVAQTEGLIGSEILVLAEIVHRSGYTRLVFTSALSNSYKRATVTINANVVLANHGESVTDEVLGNGDGAATNQTFALAKPPLTYVSAATASGSESTLTVRVDGVEWEQQASLYGLGASSRSYIVQIDDDANSTVLFGDGKNGARLPTGSENVKATYRSGIGAEGEVGTGTLTLLKTRPYGIRQVTNPQGASGADEPESLDDARTNAPLTVRTFDRIVSLLDYEDFARGFAGIGKAQGTIVWDSERECVHLTVVDANGDAVVSPLLDNLRDAVEAARDPLPAVEIASYEPLVFSLAAGLLVDEAYVFEDVATEAEQALLAAFGFAERSFAQPVTAAEILQVLHGVAGVLAVDLDALHLTDDEGDPVGPLIGTVLNSRSARYDRATGTILPAQLLLIHPYGVDLYGMGV